MSKTLFDYNLTLKEAEILIANGANIYRKGMTGLTAIHEMFYRGIPFLKLILKYQPEAFSLFLKPMTMPLAKAIINLKPDAIYEKDEYGCSVIDRCKSFELIEYYYMIAPTEFSPYQFDLDERMVESFSKLNSHEKLGILESVESLIEFSENSAKYGELFLTLGKSNPDHYEVSDTLKESNRKEINSIFRAHLEGEIDLEKRFHRKR